MYKWKVTYDEMNTVKAKIIETDLYGLANRLNTIGLYDNQIVSIEKVMEARPENIEDLTED